MGWSYHFKNFMRVCSDRLSSYLSLVHHVKPAFWISWLKLWNWIHTFKNSQLQQQLKHSLDIGKVQDSTESIPGNSSSQERGGLFCLFCTHMPGESFICYRAVLTDVGSSPWKSLYLNHMSLRLPICRQALMRSKHEVKHTSTSWQDWVLDNAWVSNGNIMKREGNRLWERRIMLIYNMGISANAYSCFHKCYWMNCCLLLLSRVCILRWILGYLCLLWLAIKAFKWC